MRQTTRIMPNGASKILIAADNSKFSEISGSWFSPYMKGKKKFCSCFQLISQVNSLYDENSFPQSSTALRSLSNEKTKHESMKKGVRKTMDDSIFSQKKGEKATFIVQVLFRQNSTWQGSIKWLETGDETKFRSTMELVNMMDKAICSQLAIEDEEAQTN